MIRVNLAWDIEASTHAGKLMNSKSIISFMFSQVFYYKYSYLHMEQGHMEQGQIL